MLIAEYDDETDIAVQRAESYEQGIQQGIERGLQQGLYQKACETAIILKYLGDSVQKITQAIGLSKAEIDAL